MHHYTCVTFIVTLYFSILYCSHLCSMFSLKDLKTSVSCLCLSVKLYSKPVLSCHSKRRPKLVFKTDYFLMQVKSIAECSKGEHSAILSTFIKLPIVIKIFVLSIFEWLLKEGFTVLYQVSPTDTVQFFYNGMFEIHRNGRCYK